MSKPDTLVGCYSLNVRHSADYLCIKLLATSAILYSETRLRLNLTFEATFCTLQKFLP